MERADQAAVAPARTRQGGQRRRRVSWTSSAGRGFDQGCHLAVGGNSRARCTRQAPDPPASSALEKASSASGLGPVVAGTQRLEVPSSVGGLLGVRGWVLRHRGRPAHACGSLSNSEFRSRRDGMGLDRRFGGMGFAGRRLGEPFYSTLCLAVRQPIISRRKPQLESKAATGSAFSR